MKRIGLLSDTHSCWDERYRTHFARCHEIWHAGDIGDAQLLARLEEIAPVRAVRGNIDHGETARRCPPMLIFDIEGLRVMITHIGGYPGRYAPGIETLLRDNRVRLMISGHSHILKVIPDPRLGLLHVNPGAAGYHGWQRVRTLVRLTVDHATVTDLEVIHLAPSTQPPSTQRQ